MVLRSGIILPFQFRDTKKLLMIGVPEENRDLSIWDLKNVVRAAFGIYNFEFRNKKIGFQIPDELLLHYLAQRHDLTNFVIEIGLADDELDLKDSMSFETNCLQKLNVPMPQKSNENTNEAQVQQNYASPIPQQHVKSPMETGTNHSDHSSNQEPPHKIKIGQVYNDDEHTHESITHAINPIDIIPKSERKDGELNARDHIRERAMLIQHQHQQQQQAQQQHQLPTQQQQHHHQQQLQQPQQHSVQHLAQHQPQSHAQQPHHATTSPFFPNYGHSMLSNPMHPPPPTPQPQPHTPTQYSPMINRFRRRGERMSKDQKELYVKYFEENPCMLQQRRNDVMLEPHWVKLANMLNTVPQGAVKNVEEWKQTFDAWRYRVFMYTRYNSKLSANPTHTPKNYKPLTATDQRAYNMWTSHKGATPQEFEKMDIFANLDETQTVYDY